jgi:hypothetical protein
MLVCELDDMWPDAGNGDILGEEPLDDELQLDEKQSDARSEVSEELEENILASELLGLPLLQQGNDNSVEDLVLEQHLEAMLHEESEPSTGARASVGETVCLCCKQQLPLVGNPPARWVWNVCHPITAATLLSQRVEADGKACQWVSQLRPRAGSVKRLLQKGTSVPPYLRARQVRTRKRDSTQT